MGFDDEYSTKYNRRSWRTILLPLMGFILAACAAGIAFVGAAPVTQLVRSRINGLPPGQELQIAVGFMIFLIMIGIFAMFYAMFAPKPPKMISEQSLDKEKKARDRERRANKKRAHQIRAEMARQNRESDKFKRGN